MALNPYSRDNSTYMPVGEAKRPNAAVEQYQSNTFENEVQGVIYALLMQYAKTDAQNAASRAQQFSAILYEYSVKLINELDISNSMIAQKIVKAIDTKTEAQLEVLIQSGDFDAELASVCSTVSEYLATLMKVANGSVSTLEQLGLDSDSKNALESSDFDLTSQTEQVKASSGGYDSELSRKLIESLQTSDAKSGVPDSARLSIPQPAMTQAVQRLAINAVTYFNSSMATFTKTFMSDAAIRFDNLKKSIQTLKILSGIETNGSREQDADNKRKSRGANPTAQLQKIASELEESERRQLKIINDWTVRVNAAKFESQIVKGIVKATVVAPVKLVSSLFFNITKHIEKTYKEAKKGGFLNYLLSPEGIIVFSLLGYGFYKLIFKPIKDKVKDSIFDSVRKFLKKRGINLDKDAEKVFDIDLFLKSLSIVNKNKEETENSDQETKEPGIYDDLLGWMKAEGNWLGSLFTEMNGENKKGFGWMMDQWTDHSVENLQALDDYANEVIKKNTGSTMNEWFNSLNKQTLDKNRSPGRIFLEFAKDNLKKFWEYVKNGICNISTWFVENTTIGQKVNAFWQTIEETAKKLSPIFKFVAGIAVKIAPILGIVAMLRTHPIGLILKTIGHLGKLFASLSTLKFMKPIKGIIGNLIHASPFVGLLVAGAAVGLGMLGYGIWRAFHRTPNDDGSIVPRDRFAASMGLAPGQERESLDIAENRIKKLRGDLAEYDVNLQFGPQRPVGVSNEALDFFGYGLDKFEQNYGDAMVNQDKNKRGTLRWFILKRAKNSSLANSSWGQILSEIPFLGIGPGLVHSDLFGEFRSTLDQKYGDHSERTWNAVAEIMKRMRSVNSIFRRLFATGSNENIQAFFDQVQTNKEAVKRIYDWTHGSGSAQDIEKLMTGMFNMTDVFKNMPDVKLRLVSSRGRLSAIVDVNGKRRDFDLGAGSFWSGTRNKENAYETLIGGALASVDRDNRIIGGGTAAGRSTTYHLIPNMVAKAFFNYMNRDDSHFRFWEPWKFQANEQKKLSVSDGEFRMKDVLKNIKRDRDMEAINDAMMQRMKKNSQYKNLPEFDGQKDSQVMAEVVYILGTVLQMCDEAGN